MKVRAGLAVAGFDHWWGALAGVTPSAGNLQHRRK